jgi:predicted nucleic acid-binding protein
VEDRRGYAVILADSSVVIEYSRGTDLKLVALIPTLRLGTCGMVRSETYSGARDPADRLRLQKVIDGFARVLTPEDVWDEAGDHYRLLRSKGVTPGLSDLIIAGVALYFDLEVWSRDNDFRLMQPHLPALRLFPEPP